MNNLSNDEIKLAISTYESAGVTRWVGALRELLAYREAQGKPVALPEHMPYLSEETLANIINQDQEGSVANAARMLAKEVKFWHEKPLFTAPQLTAVPDEPTDDERIMAIEGIIPAVDNVNSPVIPDGWAVVPIDATMDMLKEGARQNMKHESFQSVWKAMLAAAPKPDE